MFAIGATHIEAFGDSLLVEHQIYMDFICFDESLNVYLDKCLDIISTLDFFSIANIFRHDNWRANELVQQTSGCHVDHGMFHISQKPMSSLANMGEAELEPTTSATNEKSSADESQDWRKFIICYLQDSSERVENMIQRISLRWILIYGIIDGFLMVLFSNSGSITQVCGRKPK